MSDRVSMRRAPQVDQVDLRLDAADAALGARVGAALGVRLPIIANTETSSADGDRHALWLGPDEWLIAGPRGSAAATETAINEAAAGAFVTSVDVSDNRIVVEVSGRGSRALLAFGCALDLDPRRFGPGSCAQTMVARAGVVLWCPTDEPDPVFRLLVRPSFASYLETWLRDAAVGLG
ncbi:MAG: sarcosine oxidase subunit gamma family protein [Candidatus Limnocylindrales bacterium]